VRRLIATALICLLAAVGVLRSHRGPLLLLALLGAVVGLMMAVGQGPVGQRGNVIRFPAIGAAVVLVLVGIGHLGPLGIGLGLGGVLLALAPSLSRHREERR